MAVTDLYDGNSHEINTYPDEHKSLMMLICVKIYTEGFGECLGMGKCATCLFEIIESNHELTCYERNEETTLLESGNTWTEVHLSCQIMADEFINRLKVNVLS